MDDGFDEYLEYLFVTGELDNNRGKKQNRNQNKNQNRKPPAGSGCMTVLTCVCLGILLLVGMRTE